jgi:hypothetical protein
VAEEGVAEEEVLPVLLAVGFVALAPVLEVLLGEAALGEAAAVLLVLLLDALEAVDDDVSAGFASACAVPGVAVLFSELFSEWLSGELAAGEPVLWDPFPRRRERLFLAPLLLDVVAELGGDVGVLGSVASVVDAALSVVLGTP